MGHSGTEYMTCKGLQLTGVRSINVQRKNNIESTSSEDGISDVISYAANEDSSAFPTELKMNLSASLQKL